MIFTENRYPLFGIMLECRRFDVQNEHQPRFVPSKLVAELRIAGVPTLYAAADGGNRWTF